MPDDTPGNGSTRVTTAEFYKALLAQNDRMDTMERRLLESIGGVKTDVSVLSKSVYHIAETLKQEISDRKLEDTCLQAGVDEAVKKADEAKTTAAWWNGVNSVLVVIAGYLGIRQ